MVADPAATPLTMPEIEPTVAIVASLLLQTPPADVSLRVVVVPVHTL